MGATPEHWMTLVIAGLEEDLLPVVCDPSVAISKLSKLRELGKVPSIVTDRGVASGIPAWTSHITTAAHITAWASDGRHGICCQGRRLKMLDADISHGPLAKLVEAVIRKHFPDAPKRGRADSAKFLVAVWCDDPDIGKRVIRCGGGNAIELLGIGQQAVMIGTHPKGARYEWEGEHGGVPSHFPVVTREQLEAAWKDLEQFAVDGGLTSPAARSRAQLNAAAADRDPVARSMRERGMVLGQERDGRLHIECPFADLHTTESTESATTYFPANTGGFVRGHFKCLHAHCAGRSDSEFLGRLGFLADDFEDLDEADSRAVASSVTASVAAGEVDGQPAVVELAEVPIKRRPRFEPWPLTEFISRPAVRWIIKGVLPLADLGVIYGASGAGKSFTVIDLAFCIARGESWRGHKVKQMRVAYVAGEGAGGVRNRMRAKLIAAGLQPGDVANLEVIPDAPSLLDEAEVSVLIERLKKAGKFDLIIVDTLAQSMPGGDENSGEDMGKALGACKRIRRETGAMPFLVHHAGKDVERGARGWSGLKAAADVEICVSRDEHDHREIAVTKMKDGEEGATFGFRLAPVVIGVDEDGDELTSCVCEPAEKGRRVRSGPRDEYARIVLSTVDEAMGVDGTAHRKDVVKLAVDSLVHDPEAGRDRRRDMVIKGLNKLIQGGWLVLEGDFLRRSEAA